jgi:copper(I)-binding protein
MTIVNDGRESDWITAASCDAAAKVEFHTMTDEGGAMQMRPMDDVVIPPGAALAFQPGGDHVMLIGLTKPLRAGDKVTLKLTFDRHGEITIPIVVTPRTTGGEHSGHH